MFGMPRHAQVLECSADDKARLIAISKSRTEEARTVERARIVLDCLEGKEPGRRGVRHKSGTLGGST